MTTRPVGLTIGRDRSGAGDGLINVAQHAGDVDLTTAGNTHARVALNGAAMADLAGTGDGRTELLARSAGHDDLAGTGDLGLHVAAHIANVEDTATGDNQVGIFGHAVQRYLARPRQVADERPHGARHQFRPDGRTEVECAIQVVGNTHYAEEVTDLDVHGRRNHQHQLDGPAQVNLAAVQDDRVAVASRRGKADRSSVDGNVAADHAADEDIAVTEHAAGATRLERNLSLQYECIALDARSECRDHLVVAVLDEHTDVANGHGNDGHLREHAAEVDPADLRSVETLLTSALLSRQVVAVGQRVTGAHESFDLGTAHGDSPVRWMKK